jgi:hypothetical protein
MLATATQLGLVARLLAVLAAILSEGTVGLDVALADWMRALL